MMAADDSTDSAPTVRDLEPSAPTERDVDTIRDVAPNTIAANTVPTGQVHVAASVPSTSSLPKSGVPTVAKPFAASTAPDTTLLSADTQRPDVSAPPVTAPPETQLSPGITPPQLAVTTLSVEQVLSSTQPSAIISEIPPGHLRELSRTLPSAHDPTAEDAGEEEVQLPVRVVPPAPSRPKRTGRSPWWAALMPLFAGVAVLTYWFATRPDERSSTGTPRRGDSSAPSATASPSSAPAFDWDDLAGVVEDARSRVGGKLAAVRIYPARSEVFVDVSDGTAAGSTSLRYLGSRYADRAPAKLDDEARGWLFEVNDRDLSRGVLIAKQTAASGQSARHFVLKRMDPRATGDKPVWLVVVDDTTQIYDLAGKPITFD